MKALCCRMVLVTTALTLFTGCFSAPRFTPEGGLYSDDAAARFCTEIKASEQVQPVSFRALVVTTVSDGDEVAGSFRYAIASENKQNARIDILPPEGAFTLGIFVVRDGKASFIDVSNKRYRTDCQPEDVYREFFQVEGVSPGILRSLLLGTTDIVSCKNVQVFFSDNQHTATLVDTERHIAWTIDPDEGVVEAIEILNDDNDRVLIRAKRFNSSALPNVLMSVFEPVGLTVEMDTVKLSKGVDIPSGIFSVHIPRAYKQDGCNS